MTIHRFSFAIAITIAVVGPVSMPGCGLAVRKQDAESLAAFTTVNRFFPESSHRVALATFEAMRGELASAEFAKDSEFSSNPKLLKPGGTQPREGELPPNFPAFWLEWKSKGQSIRGLVTLKACHYSGKTRDGRPVEVAVLLQPGGSVVTVQVDKLGDRAVSQALLDKVAGRLAHPACSPGSLEEAATFKAFFGGVESREALPSIRKAAESGR
jgi:hypothetical protein